MLVNASKWVRRSSRETDVVLGLGPALPRRVTAPSHHWLVAVRTARLMRRSVVVCCLSFVALCACRSEKEREVSREIAAMAHLINQLRDAPHNAKAEPLRLASEIQCKAAPVCELQQVCVQAYRLHADAIQLGVQASRSESNPDLIRDVLARAERDLGLAKDGMDRCVALQGELTREYKL